MTSKKLNEAAQILEDMTQRDIRTLAEFCIDHMTDPMEVLALRRYMKDHLDIELK